MKEIFASEEAQSACRGSFEASPALNNKEKQMLVVYERDMLPDMPLFLYVWWWSSLFRHVWGTWVFNIKSIQFGNLLPAMWDSFLEMLFVNKFPNMRWKFVYEEAWVNYRAFLDKGKIVHIKKL